MATRSVGRRQFVTRLGSAAAALVIRPLAASTQQVPVIGILGSATAESWAPRFAAFRQGLMESGFVEGQNLAMELRWANNDYDRLPDLAADLVRRRVTLIAAMGNNLPTRAAQSVTSTIPIVFMMGADPIQIGVVPSLSRPGGNITGVTMLASDLTQKRVQLLHDLVPNAKVFGLLFNPENLSASSSDGHTQVQLAQAAVGILGGSIQLAPARTVDDFDAAFASLVEKRVDAVFTTAEALFVSGQKGLVALAAVHSLPMVFLTPEAAKAGGLASYSASATDGYRQGGLYAGRILNGAKPADLPVLQPTKFDLVINVKTAKALGLTVSNSMQLLADEVIE